jgi:hypothetical protein
MHRPGGRERHATSGIKFGTTDYHVMFRKFFKLNNNILQRWYDKLSPDDKKWADKEMAAGSTIEDCYEASLNDNQIAAWEEYQQKEENKKTANANAGGAAGGGGGQPQPQQPQQQGGIEGGGGIVPPLPGQTQTSRQKGSAKATASNTAAGMNDEPDQQQQLPSANRERSMPKEMKVHVTHNEEFEQAVTGGIRNLRMRVSKHDLRQMLEAFKIKAEESYV